MKIFSASFSITLLLTCPFIYSMGTYQKTMHLQQEPQNHLLAATTNGYMPDIPVCTVNSQRSNYLNYKARRALAKRIKDASTIEDTENKKATLTALQTKLLCLKKTALEEINQIWIEEQLQEIKKHINACYYSEPKIESADLETMSQTVLLEKEFLTHTQRIAQEEAQLNQIKLEAEHCGTALKDRLLRKKEILTCDAKAALLKEQKLRAKLLKIQQELTTTQLQKQEFEQLLHDVQSRIAVIEDYTPQSTELASTSSVSQTQTSSTDALYNEPTDDLQVELAQTEFPLLSNKQTNGTKNSLSHSCNLQ